MGKGFVYLLMDSDKEGVYKIGVTKGSIENRIKKLQTGNSSEISICNYYETDMPYFLEKKLHDHYKGYNVSGEWYELSDEDVLGFENECKQIEDMIISLKDNPFIKRQFK